MKPDAIQRIFLGLMIVAIRIINVCKCRVPVFEQYPPFLLSAPKRSGFAVLLSAIS
jgi:hypothetical protein